MNYEIKRKITQNIISRSDYLSLSGTGLTVILSRGRKMQVPIRWSFKYLWSCVGCWYILWGWRVDGGDSEGDDIRCSTLRYIILYHTTLHHDTRHYIMTHNITPHHTTPHHTLQHHTTLNITKIVWLRLYLMHSDATCLVSTTIASINFPAVTDTAYIKKQNWI